MFCVYPSSLIWSTQKENNSPFSRITNMIPNSDLFLNRVPIENFLKLFLLMIVLPMGDRTYSVQEERLDLPYVIMILAVCVSADVSKYLVNLTLEFFKNVGASSILTWVQADTASVACLAHPGSPEIMSMTFAAVICDADDPCSVNSS